MSAKNNPENTNVQVDLIQNFSISDLHLTWQELSQWSSDFFWDQNTLIQLMIFLGAFIIAGIIDRLVHKPIVDHIDTTKMPVQVKRVANQTMKLILPILWLFFMFTISLICTAFFPGLENNLLSAFGKVLFAWIIIRIAVQFIANRFVRNVFAMCIWIMAALSIFGVLDETAATLDTIGFNIGSFRLSALVAIKGIFSLFALLYFAIFISGFAERRVFEIKSLTRSSQVLAAKVIRVSLIVSAILIGITSAGIDLSLFAVFGGAIGLGIGFGLQKGISNLFSGMLLLMDQSIKPGDVIEIPDIGTFGWVNQMAARYTEIVTRDNKSFLIPNEDFITQRVVNWSHGNSLIRLQVTFGVHYDSDPHKVKEIAEEATKDLERVVDTPSPVCWLVEFGDSSLNFSLRFWIKDAEAGVTNIKGTVMMALWDAFKENDIKIPYPHREIIMSEGD